MVSGRNRRHPVVCSRWKRIWYEDMMPGERNLIKIHQETSSCTPYHSCFSSFAHRSHFVKKCHLAFDRAKIIRSLFRRKFVWLLLLWPHFVQLKLWMVTLGLSITQTFFSIRTLGVRLFLLIWLDGWGHVKVVLKLVLV